MVYAVFIAVSSFSDASVVVVVFLRFLIFYLWFDFSLVLGYLNYVVRVNVVIFIFYGVVIVIIFDYGGFWVMYFGFIFVIYFSVSLHFIFDWFTSFSFVFVYCGFCLVFFVFGCF